MAAAEERSPEDREEEEEEVVSATAEACAMGGGGDGRAGCVWEGSRDAARARRPHGRSAHFLPRDARSRGEAGLSPICHSVVRMGAVEEVALDNVACFLSLKAGPGFH